MTKLTRKQKIEIYEGRLNREYIKSLSINLNIRESNIRYLISLISKHGHNILRKNKNRYYKEIAINRVLIGKESINFVSIDFDLYSCGILHNWIKKYKENCYNVIDKKKGRKTKKYD